MRAFAPLGMLLLILLVASGCRTYGNYGNEEALVEEILEANRLFAEDLGRARGDLAALERTVAANATLDAFVGRYVAVVEAHEAIVAAHEILAGEAEEHDGNYRFLNRTYGAIISDQQIIRDRYEELIGAMARAVAADTSEAAAIPPESSYQAKPPFYEKIEYQNGRQALASVLAEARGEPMPAAAPADTLGSN